MIQPRFFIPDEPGSFRLFIRSKTLRKDFHPSHPVEVWATLLDDVPEMRPAIEELSRLTSKKSDEIGDVPTGSAIIFNAGRFIIRHSGPAFNEPIKWMQNVPWIGTTNTIPEALSLAVFVASVVDRHCTPDDPLPLARIAAVVLSDTSIIPVSALN